MIVGLEEYIICFVKGFEIIFQVSIALSIVEPLFVVQGLPDRSETVDIAAPFDVKKKRNPWALNKARREDLPMM